MISYDFRAVERVTQFASFLDALADPKGLKGMIADLDQKAKELKALMESKTKLDEIDGYKAKIQSELEVWDKELKAKEEAQNALLVEADRTLTEARAEAASIIASAKEAMKQARVANEMAQKGVETLAEDRKAYEVALAQLQTAQEELRVERQAILDKQEQLKKLIGG